MDKWESIADRRIREAMEAGAFDDLPSKGKPIPIDSNPFEAPELWMAHHVLRVNGFVPPWIDEAASIDQEIEGLRSDLNNARRARFADRPGWLRAVNEFRTRAEELNRDILTYNLKSPSTKFHKLLLNIDREIQLAEAAG